VTDRERALRILERVTSKKLAAFEAIAREPGIEHPDFVRTLVHGVLRWQGRLDHAIATLASRNISRIDTRVLLLLRLGTYQLWFMEVPSYACVSETTQLAGRVASRARSFVNAVMRRASERSLESLDPEGDSTNAIAIRTSHPEWLLQGWIDTYGRGRALEIARANQELSWPDLLVNTRKWSRDEAQAAIRERHLEVEVSELADNTLRLRSGTATISDLIRDGRVYPMDEGSVAVTTLVPCDSRRILDVCAAPGGKSISLALREFDVTSCDISFGRMCSLRAASSRFFGTNPRGCVTDALQPAFSSTWDTVFVDAPCSATGTIRKNPEVRWRVSKGEIEEMAALQKRILDSCLHLSRRFLVYVTCSLERSACSDSRRSRVRMVSRQL